MWVGRVMRLLAQKESSQKWLYPLLRAFVVDSPHVNQGPVQFKKSMLNTH